MDARESARRFLGHGGTDHRGRTLAAILAWPDARLEAEHDFIQWLFPLETPSPVNPEAPVPTRADFAALAADPAVLDGARAAYARMLSFYGLRRDGDGRVVRDEPWRGGVWADAATHNDRRLTRMLHALALLGLREEADALLAALEALMAECRGARGAEPLAHWRRALRV